MYMKSHKMTKDALQLVARFERLTGDVAAPNATILLGNDWTQEDRHMGHLIDIGKGVGQNRIEDILTGSRGGSNVDADSTHVAQMLYLSTEHSASGGWGKVAKKQRKLYGRLINSIPKDHA